MTPQIGQYVKLMFSNGLSLEGVITSWSSENSVIKSETGNLIIVQETKKNVIAIVLLSEHEQTHKATPEIEERVVDPSLKAKKLTDLHILKIKEEQESIRKKLTTFENTGIQQAEYGLPRRIQQKPSHYDPRKKA